MCLHLRKKLKIPAAILLCAVVNSACGNTSIDLETIAETAAVETAAALSQLVAEPTQKSASQVEDPTPPAVETENNAPDVVGAIAYVSDRDGDLEIYITDPTGDTTIQFSNNSGDDYSPVWSPETATLAYVSSRPGGLALFVENFDHSSIIRLSDTLASSIWNEPQVQSFDTLTWSPTGQIGYGSNRCAANCGSPPCPEPSLSYSGSSEWEVKKKMQNAIDKYTKCLSDWWDGQLYTTDIYAIDSQGGGEEYITFDQNLYVHGPSFSPRNGKFAAAVTNFDSTGIERDIYLFDKDGRKNTPLITGSSDDHSPSWSPDGSKIAFVSLRDGNPEIYVINRDGKNLRRLTHNPAHDEFPVWSPDGEMIAFASNRDGNEEIYIMSLKDQTLVNISNNPANDFNPTWTALVDTDEHDTYIESAEADIQYETTFQDFQTWFTYEISDYLDNTYSKDANEGKLKFTLQKPNVGVYSLYGSGINVSDIDVQTSLETLTGSSRNSAVLVCRASNRGWYEFGLDSGGLWFIRKFDQAINEYIDLISGGSFSINLGEKENSMEASCIGRELELKINGELIGQTEDIQFKEGTFGLGVQSFDVGNAFVSFRYFEASTPR